MNYGKQYSFILSPHHQSPRLCNHVDRQAQVYIQVVAYQWASPLDTRDPRRSLRYLAGDAMADVSQGWEESFSSLDPCDCYSMGFYKYICLDFVVSIDFYNSSVRYCYNSTFSQTQLLVELVLISRVSAI